MAAHRRALTTVAVLAAVAAAAGACTTTPQPIPGAAPTVTGPSSTPEPAPGQVAGVPIPDGRIDHAVGRLDAIAADAMAAPDVTGMAIAVVHDGAVVFERGYGTTTAPAGAPAPDAGSSGAGGSEVDKDTVFPVGALSAPVSATVVATQLTGGRSWSTPVRELMPQFAVADPYVSEHATVGDMFAGTSGLPEDAGTGAARIGVDRQSFLGRLDALPLAGFRTSARPGALGPTIAGEAAARAAGTDWATLSDRSLFHRLGMESTSYRSRDFAADTDSSASALVAADGTVTPVDRAWADAVAPARGLTSSVHDMAAWMRVVLAGGMSQGLPVIPAEPLSAALSPQAVAPDTEPANAVDARGVARGFGFNVTDSAAGRVVITGGGAAGPDAAGGPDSAMTLIPSAGIGIVTLTDAVSTPARPVAAAQVVNAEFTDLVQFGDVQRDWKAWFTGTPSAGAGAPSTSTAGPSGGSPAPGRISGSQENAPLPAFDGVYTNPFYGEATVRTSNDTTTLTVGTAPETYRLTRTGDTAFAVTPADPAAPRAEVFLRAHPDAAVSFDGDALTIGFLDQAGAFRR
ncbi:serine hydrolase domain-containing protein [Tomitella fengzijianii]|uniref:Beta-lactamase family protein n=1 Tax=Tomitella fengzijianii TaxID=2597660 RepID=A0A516X293_9ACTN|nr:serine hydrolase domain-containing protein [Tomitella fengzijianii]QDQ97147.1 beta-lactamase family protein [Tomitella fengzijianii]